MSHLNEEWHVTPAGGNVFADLGFDSEEAAKLKAEADGIIAKKLALKEELMGQIAVWMTENQMKQVEAAAVLGITRPRVSDVLQKKATKFSIDSLIDMIARTGRQVTLTVV